MRRFVMGMMLAGGLLAGCEASRGSRKKDASGADASDSSDGADASDAAGGDVVGGDGVDATDGSDGSDATDGGDGSDATDGNVGVDAIDATDGGEAVFAAIEIEDDPNNSTLDPCDGGTLKSPGADIDAAELVTSTGGTAYLTNCQISNTSACSNDSAKPANAEGAPDASGKEETGTYTSLNGGTLRCSWAGGVAAGPQDEVEVIEIGGTAGTNVEQYLIRLCATTAGNCTRDSVYSTGDARFPLAELF